MKLLKLDQEVYHWYRQHVKGNEYTTYEQAQKKLTRNKLLSVRKITLLNILKGQQEYIYGHLKMIVKKGKIIALDNNSANAIPGWVKDEYEYDRISEQLGIRDNKFRKSRH